MTLQISDKFYYNANEYNLLYKEGDELLFNPSNHGFDPYDNSSGCWKGYLCEYIIDNNYLKLDNLYINNKVKIPFNGIRPDNFISTLVSLVKDKNSLHYITSFDHKYTNINFKINYTGECLIGYGYTEHSFDYEYYNYNCVLSPHSFTQVLKLQFNKGKLINITDISSELESLRKELQLQYTTTKRKDIYDLYK